MNADSVTCVAVLGLGTMGHGIAQAFAAGGFQVRCHDEQPGARQSVIERIQANLQQMAAAGIGDRASIPKTLARISVCNDEADTVGPAHFVTEAVSEDLAIKQDLFARLESMVSAETVLASNSSSYPISETASRMQHPERAVVTHWFNPPHLVPVVEVVGGQRTAAETVQTTVELLRRIGKTPVRINKEIPGFLVNRVQIAMFREIWDLLDRGVASAQEIDEAIRGSMGLRLAALGPLRIIDFAGWDITGRVYENLVQDIRSDRKLPDCIQAMLERGHFGVKSGEGVYRYTPQEIGEKRAERDRLYLALLKLLNFPNAPSSSG